MDDVSHQRTPLATMILLCSISLIQYLKKSHFLPSQYISFLLNDFLNVIKEFYRLYVALVSSFVMMFVLINLAIFPVNSDLPYAGLDWYVYSASRLLINDFGPITDHSMDDIHTKVILLIFAMTFIFIFMFGVIRVQVSAFIRNDRINRIYVEEEKREFQSNYSNFYGKASQSNMYIPEKIWNKVCSIFLWCFNYNEYLLRISDTILQNNMDNEKKMIKKNKRFNMNITDPEFSHYMNEFRTYDNTNNKKTYKLVSIIMSVISIVIINLSYLTISPFMDQINSP